VGSASRSVIKQKCDHCLSPMGIAGPTNLIVTKPGMLGILMNDSKFARLVPACLRVTDLSQVDFRFLPNDIAIHMHPD
jgi:hypothetical protein